MSRGPLKDGVSAGYTLRQMVLNVGFEVLTRLLEEDREELCGPRKRKQTDRSAYRYGYDLCLAETKSGSPGAAGASAKRRRAR